MEGDDRGRPKRGIRQRAKSFFRKLGPKNKDGPRTHRIEEVPVKSVKVMMINIPNEIASQFPQSNGTNNQSVCQNPQVDQNTTENITENSLNDSVSDESVDRCNTGDSVSSDFTNLYSHGDGASAVESEEWDSSDIQTQQSTETGIVCELSDLQQEFLDKLGLTEYFPEKISEQIAKEKSSFRLQSLTDLPWYLINKILMLDCRGRDNEISDDILNNDIKSSKSSSSTYSSDNMFSELGECVSYLPHPMDVLVTVYWCSSNFLRQLISEKMFMCKLGIPLVLPPFLDSETMFLLWSLRGIALEFRTNDEPCVGSVISNPFPIVAFMRLGEISRSKSKFVNEILNGQSHPTFYHRDCEGGMNDRILSEGMIEIAWCLHSQNMKNLSSLASSEKNKFQTSDTALLNLRGDGKSHEVTTSFLCQISDVVLVMVDVNELDDQDTAETLKFLSSCSKQLVLILSQHPGKRFSLKNQQDIRRCAETLKFRNFGKDNIIYEFNVRGEKNIKILKKETEDIISNCLEEKPSKCCFVSYKSLAESLNIIIDENVPACSTGRERAFEVVAVACENGKDNLRSTKLPLQCRPWQEWSKLDKEEHRREKRGKEEISIYMDKLHKEKKEHRLEQIHLVQNPTNKLFRVFLEHLFHSSTEERPFYLKWLKLELNDISREIIPSLQNRLSAKWNEIHQCKEQEILSTLKMEIDQIEKELADSSFGLEHFIREIAQAYEAVKNADENLSKDIKDRIVGLPKVMAELMVLGYPLELMDGDAASVPLLWIKAVLEHLKELIGDKKIFVLSVLGIQSSGKSTMLNAMFGLQFTVSAGRCTRGVYAQLVPIPEEYSNEVYDYVLVVDTEGLRAAELGAEKLQHDNEIATLVIGLGDVTLVNVKGENVAELEDVLQIVIHALLKMKLVNKNLALQPSCFFIHQNVSAADAAQKLRGGQQKFIDTLDKVTEAAGKQEDAPQYTKFSQVINFDIRSNIEYFSDLWSGNPPMGHANPGYSENIANVKQILLKDIMPKRTSNLNISKLAVKIQDLWNGILDQNFVFSFKNNLEMEAYSSLESKLSDLLWQIKKAALKWQSDKENKIMSSENGVDNLEKLKGSLVRECCIHLEELYIASKKNLADIFESVEDRSVLEQWRISTFQKLENCYEDVIDRTARALTSKINIRQIQIDQKRDIEKYKDRIMKEAKKVAEDLRSNENEQNLSDEELEVRFSGNWDRLIARLPKNHEDETDIEERVKNVLFEKFNKDSRILRKVLEDLHIEDVTVIRKNFSFVMERYVSEQRGFGIFKFGSKKITSDEFLNEEYARIISLVEAPIGYESSYIINNFLTIAEDIVDRIRDSGLTISDEAEFEMCIAICTCQYASFEFSKKGVMETVNNGKYRMGKFGIHPYFEEELVKKFPLDIMEVVHKFSQKKLTHSMICIEKDVSHKGIDKRVAEECVEDLVSSLNEFVESYVKRPEIQGFREEYAEEIITNVITAINKTEYVTFKKESVISVVVHFCYLALPKFINKHKRFVDSLSPRKVLERDYYGTYLQMFKNSYHKITGEKALSKVLCQRLITAIEKTVDQEMAANLADDVRNNVPEVKMKPALLKAVLLQLLEVDSFEEFVLYLEDTNACFERWISYYIDNYLLSSRGEENNRYTEIAFRNISSILCKVCEDVLKPVPHISETLSGSNALNQWIKEFQMRISGKLALSQQDLLHLTDGYDILTIRSFKDQMVKDLRAAETKLKRIFCAHAKEHLRYAHDVSVYELIYRECKGCTERCPFCSAPCTLNTAGHAEQGADLKHIAKEHYPQACGKYRSVRTGKLVVENCSTLIAGDGSFKSSSTGMISHPYKEYQKHYPDWRIDADPSVEASPYWKWFLVKYESELTERYKAERPDIPNSWRDITKEKARESVDSESCFKQCVPKQDS